MCFPEACDLIFVSNPLVGICMASPNTTQPHALQRNLYQHVRLANNEHQQVADIDCYCQEGCSKRPVGKESSRRFTGAIYKVYVVLVSGRYRGVYAGVYVVFTAL